MAGTDPVKVAGSDEGSFWLIFSKFWQYGGNGTAEVLKRQCTLVTSRAADQNNSPDGSTAMKPRMHT